MTHDVFLGRGLVLDAEGWWLMRYLGEKEVFSVKHLLFWIFLHDHHMVMGLMVLRLNS